MNFLILKYFFKNGNEDNLQEIISRMSAPNRIVEIQKRKGMPLLSTAGFYLDKDAKIKKHNFKHYLN